MPIDGQPPLADPHAETDAHGNGRVDGRRLYQFVRQTPPVDDRLFEIVFLDAGARACAFTFG